MNIISLLIPSVSKPAQMYIVFAQNIYICCVLSTFTSVIPFIYIIIFACILSHYVCHFLYSYIFVFPCAVIFAFKLKNIYIFLSHIKYYFSISAESLKACKQLFFYSFLCMTIISPSMPVLLLEIWGIGHM